MTKKHFIALAEELHLAATTLGPNDKLGFDLAVNAIVATLRQSNPRFDEQCFRNWVLAGPRGKR